MTLEITKQEHNSFYQIKHAANAIAKDGSRPVLQLLEVTDDKIIGCDGFRLHISPNNNALNPGYYHVEKNLKTKVVLEQIDMEEFTKTYGHYPDVTAVCPSNHLLELFSVNSMDKNSVLPITASHLIGEYSIFCEKWHNWPKDASELKKPNIKVKNTFSIDCDKLQEAIEYFDTFKAYASLSDNGVGPVKLESECGMLAVIMPLIREKYTPK